ncbi:MAG: hypothetical protein GXP61_09515 [Epsilonproteobacteria bacterium]|nr:hypothetical protein [Campylobacterota bacterium]
MKNLLLIIIAFLFVNCAIKEPKVIKYKQDIAPYAKNIEPLHVELEKFNSHYYMPWDIDSIKVNKKIATWANKLFFKDKKFFSENTLAWSINEILPIIKSTNFEDFNTTNLYAITSRNAQIRNLPTNKPFFRDFKKAGEGYPFDYLQNSRIHIDTPLIISHYSSDGSWAFVQNPFSFGWIPTNSIAILNQNQIDEYENAPKIVIIKDGAPIYAKHQKFFTYANLGALFPLVSEDKQFYYSYTFINSFEKNNQKIMLVIPKNLAKKFPLAFDSEDIKQAANELLGQKYGWGGYLGDRDCSSLTKDFLSLFGVWLPRNSAAQKDAGEYISLKEKSNEEKEQIISKKAIAFRTLIYLKGHIMLYIGKNQNRVMVLQNLWGLRTQIGDKTGRYIIGKAIISDLHLGEKLKDVKAKSLLISRVQGIAILNDIQY